MFVGQAEQKQKYQVKAIEDFRNNSVNVLISTSIGEEGLDVGEVDLIICFDISQKSPTRLVQRMGRTGRKRDGHIIVLVTNGKEHETLKSTMARRESLNSKILNTSNITSSLYQNNPRMIPKTCSPQCYKMHINVQQKVPIAKGKKSKRVGNKNIKKTKNNRESSSNELNDATQLTMAKFLQNTNKEQLNNDDNTECTKLTTMPVIDQHNINISTKPVNEKLVPGDNRNNLIKPSNVKLLTCDNQIIEFLTLCGIKNSEKENTSKVSKMDTTYVCTPKKITNFFDFSVPDINILDNLANHLINIQDIKSQVDKESQIEYDNNFDLECNNEYTTISPVNPAMNECINISESRFEDLLDESTDSDETIFSFTNENINEEINNVNVKYDKAGSVTNIKSPIKSDDGNDPNTNHDLAMAAESSLFEDIFNDSFDSFKSDSNIHEIENNELKEVDSNDDSVENKNNRIVKEQDNVILPTIQAKAMHLKNETMFTITQAVNEIARINSNEDGQSAITEIKDTVQYKAQSSKDTSSNNTLSLQNMTINDYESEEDIFALEFDENFEMDVLSNKSSNNENLKDDNLSNVNFNNHVNTEHKSNNQIEINNSEQKKDFQVSSHSVTKSQYFKHSTNVTLKNTSTEPSSFVNDIIWDDTDSDEWISVKPRSELQKKKSNDCMRIAKKLSERKNSFPSCTYQPIPMDHSISNQNDSDSDFVINTNDLEQLDNLETTYFTAKKSSKAEDQKTSFAMDNKDVSFNRILTQDLNYFKAPNKYLKKPYCNDIANAEPSQSKHTKLSGNLTNTSNKSIKKKNKGTAQCEYIDDEAEVSFNNTSDESSGLDEDLPDFVSYTQHVQDEVDMHAIYLQGIKSPVNRHGAFVFKEPPVLEEELDVYSQPCSQAEQSYLQDSFCVDNDHDELEGSKLVHGYSILEEAERILKEKKRKRVKCNESDNDVWKRRKRRKRIEILNISTSSEDETEKMRKEIGNESMVLKS